MAAGAKPATARWRLRREIRKARDAAALTQGQVADALHWSISKVNRIETGENTISSTDLEALLRLLDVRDEDLAGRMRAYARAARKRGEGWWDEPRFRNLLRPTTVQMLQFESEATAIRVFNYAAFPALLQTPEYAQAVVRTLGGESNESESSLNTLAEVRIRRQDALRARPDKPQYLVILDELLLQRVVGDDALMARQLRCVADAAREPNTLIRLLPKQASAHILVGSFVLFDFDEEISAVLYREVSIVDEIIHTEDDIARHRVRFERMWELCLSEEATIAEIEARHAAVRARLLRHDGQKEPSNEHREGGN
jgi:transcriptional regulator with XRE-family HTH domain